MEKLQLQKEMMIDLMYNLDYSEGTIKKHLLRIDQFINFLNTNSLSACKESADQFCSYQTNHSTRAINKDYYLQESKRVIHKFIRFIEDGFITTREPSLSYNFSGVHSNYMNQFIESESLKLKPSTLSTYKHHLCLLQVYLSDNNIQALTPNCISEYFLEFSRSNPHPYAFYHLTTVMKKYLNFLFSNDFTSNNLSHSVPKAKYQRSNRLPSVYNKEEIKKILNTIDRTSSIGKRNFAMISLAVYLGLRCGDIVNLKFENIDWQKKVIKLTMSKTEKDIELPLLPELGNAILDYLKKGRRSCKLDNVFISDKGPVSTIKSAALYGVVKRSINKTNIDINNRKVGPHSLRHSLATRLLNNGESLPVISAVLGHSDSQVTTIYTSINFDSLKHCALEVPPLISTAYECEVI